jgi:DNA processing protein
MTATTTAPPTAQDRLARTALAYATTPGDPRVHALVRQHGPTGACERLITSETGTNWRDSSPAHRAHDAPHATAQRLLVPGDPDWPVRLDELPVPPLTLWTLWTHGTAPLSVLAEAVTVTGARAATAYGVHVAGDIAAGLSGRAVVGGGGFGIEAAAHRAALAAGHTTVAVLASGLDRLHPATNTALLETIAEHGLLISEAPPGIETTRVRAVHRNRVLAALTTGIVLVEAAPRSLALATVTTALDLDRTAMAVPGPVTSALSAAATGCSAIPGCVWSPAPATCPSAC